MKNTKVQIFATKNDTGKTAVILDGYFQLFDMPDYAEVIYQEACKGEDSIENTPFGAIELLPPMTGEGDNLSEYTQTDLFYYMQTERAELKKRAAEEEKDAVDLDWDVIFDGALAWN